MCSIIGHVRTLLFKVTLSKEDTLLWHLKNAFDANISYAVL